MMTDHQSNFLEWNVNNNQSVLSIHVFNTGFPVHKLLNNLYTMWNITERKYNKSNIKHYIKQFKVFHCLHWLVPTLFDSLPRFKKKQFTDSSVCTTHNWKLKITFDIIKILYYKPTFISAQEIFSEDCDSLIIMNTSQRTSHQMS